MVALTFAGSLAWSAWMSGPAKELAVAWREKHGSTTEAEAARDPLLAWGRHDATLDAILTSAVWPGVEQRGRKKQRARDGVWPDRIYPDGI